MEEKNKTFTDLHETREIAKCLFSDKYKSRMRYYLNTLADIMKENNIDVIPAFIKIKDSEEYKKNGLAQICYMAAVVELTEQPLKLSKTQI
jgi:hypothetical protein